MAVTKSGVVLSALLATGYAMQAVGAPKAEYCDGRVFAVAFTSTVTPGNDLTSRVEYFVTLNNVTGQPLHTLVKFRYGKAAANLTKQLDGVKVIPPTVLEKVLLASQTMNNPLGRGRLDETALRESFTLFCDRR
jgi:hypothetical protein